MKKSRWEYIPGPVVIVICFIVVLLAAICEEPDAETGADLL